MSFQEPNPYASPNAAGYAPPRVVVTGRPLAGLGDRFAGALLDGLIMVPLAFGAGIAMGMGLLVAGLHPESVAFKAAAALFGAFIGGGIFLVINGYLLATRGQTVGKVVMKTQIVSNDGTLVPIGMLILRRYVPLWIATNLPGVGPFLALGNALAIFRENRKCIHDEIAGTKVIKLIG
jgi:uncharacterized RDD family membrane protein YckC